MIVTLHAKLFLGFLVLLVVWRVVIILMPKSAKSDVYKFGKKLRLLIPIVIVGVVGLIGWDNYQKKISQKSVEDLFTYLDSHEFEKAYHQFSPKFHSIYSYTPQSYAKDNETLIKEEIISIEEINDNILVNQLTLDGTLGGDAQNLSFQDYQNKKLFKVKYYRESPEDTEVYDETQMYCSSPGIIFDAYFGVVQIDAFTWKILFLIAKNIECKGENRYAEHKRKQEEEARKKNETLMRDIVKERTKVLELNNLRNRFKKECPSKFIYKNFLEKTDEYDAYGRRKRNLRYLNLYKKEINKYCMCVFNEVKDNSFDLKTLLDATWWSIFNATQSYNDPCGNKPKQFYFTEEAWSRKRIRDMREKNR